MRGCNWFPSWAASPVDHWAGDLPREAVRRELGFAALVGFDAVRIWLSAAGYERDPDAYLRNVGFVLDMAEARGVAVVLELFDSCGIEPSTGHAVPARIEDVPRLAPGDVRLDGLRAWAADADVFDAPGLVEIPWRGDPYVAVWEGWVPNPGYDLLGAAHWPRWDAYARALVGAVRDHPALVLVELMNEPFVSHLGVDIDRAPIIDFFVHVHGLVRDVAPDLPLSIGAAVAAEFADHERDIGAPLDVVSFHSYDDGPGLAAAIATAVEFADGRPVLLSEWGCFPGGDDAVQRDVVERRLGVVDDAGIGWVIAHLVMGYGPFANAALLYPNGVMRPAAQLLRRRLAMIEPA
jgi:hypothetical protein